jgi:hypothetical protein
MDGEVLAQIRFPGYCAQKREEDTLDQAMVAIHINMLTSKMSLDF